MSWREIAYGMVVFVTAIGALVLCSTVVVGRRVRA